MYPAANMSHLQNTLTHAMQLLKRDPAAALQELEGLKDEYTGQPAVLHGYAIALRQNGRVEDALVVLDRLVALEPRFAHAWYERALAGRVLRRYRQSLSDLETTVELKPDFAPAWRALGDAYAATEDPEKSNRAYERYLELGRLPPLLEEAMTAMHQGRIAVAEDACRRYLHAHPTDVTAIRLLADIGIKVGQFGDAENLLRRCLELAPDFTFARYNYAFVLTRQGKFEDAIEELDKLLATDGHNPNYHVLKAASYVRLGQFEPAIEIYESLLDDAPHQPRVYLSYGHALKTVGRQAEAIAAYRKAVEQAPELGEAYWSLANLKTVTLSDDEVMAMEAALKRPALTPEDAAQLSFALAKALEDRQEYDRAFKHYAEGNEVRRRQSAYSGDEQTAKTERSIGFFDSGFFGARKGWGADAPDPIFIVGLPRAGSTLLEQILASHSMVEGTQELPEVISLSRRLGGKKHPSDRSLYPDMLADLGAGDIRALGEEYIDRTRRYRTGTPFFIDKMPNNFEHIGLIHLMLPNAKIIDARRHPLACCFSGFKQYFARGQRFSYSLSDIGGYYRNYVALMEHFDAVLPGRVHRVQYETLVEDFEAEVRRLLDYCGLPFEPGCLEFYKNDRAVKTASSEQVRQPVFKDAVDHWRNFLPHLDPLMHALGPEVLARYPADGSGGGGSD
ncbi:tetratricopeptide repeat-containing sulfotransferase family protein [Kordiimonas gwangyangensis]|uniref:tetratricopeptide repeat-containing sulfotransferase family protein n=1 Tax=Kordiimonas gwangyangensis TaxID=288022 RepID=UPI000377617D|nr:tetratricopeptide repeat-containing sulfotransferase family protein [Kordiimonas gwangyangensis]